MEFVKKNVNIDKNISINMKFVKKNVNINILNPFIISPTQKGHTHLNLQQKATNFLSVLDHSVGLVLKVFTGNFC